MTVQELAQVCTDAIQRGQKLQLVVPWETRDLRVRLFRTRGPLSKEIACVNRGNTVAWWDPSKVLAYLTAQGLGPDLSEADVDDLFGSLRLVKVEANPI